MNPLTSLLLGGLFNVGGGLLGGLFGRGQANRQEAYRQQILRALSPANAMNLTHQFYNQFLGGPAYTSAAQGAYARGNVLQNNLASSLAARGLGTSGIGSIAGPLAANAAGGYLGQARLGGYEGAQQSAMGAIRNQLHRHGQSRARPERLRQPPEQLLPGPGWRGRRHGPELRSAAPVAWRRWRLRRRWRWHAELDLEHAPAARVSDGTRTRTTRPPAHGGRRR